MTDYCAWAVVAAFLVGAGLAAATITALEAYTLSREVAPRKPSHRFRATVARSLTCGHTRSTKGCTLCGRRMK